MCNRIKGSSAVECGDSDERLRGGFNEIMDDAGFRDFYMQQPPLCNLSDKSIKQLSNI